MPGRFSFILTVLAIVVAFGGASVWGQETALKITSAQLINAYEENELAADRLYLGKKVTISGTVDTITLDHQGTPYVHFARGRIDSLKYIRYYPAQVETLPEILAKMLKGETFTTTCEIKRRSLGAVEPGSCLID